MSIDDFRKSNFVDCDFCEILLLLVRLSVIPTKNHETNFKEIWCKISLQEAVRFRAVNS
jgi:hypothetical protein